MTIAPPSNAPPRAPTSRPRRPFGRMVLAALSGLLLAVGWMVLGAGGVVLATDSMARDADGYLMSDTATWSSPGCAVQSDAVLVHGGHLGFTLPHRMLGEFHARAHPAGDHGVFIGIASARDVARYLDDVARTTLPDPSSAPSTSRFVDGGSPRSAPTDSPIWVASASGDGTEEITWDPRPGRWRLVVMNAEGTTPVAADVAVGAEVPALRTLGWTLVATGLVVISGSAVGLTLGLRRGP